jgi:hypothetical protein
MYEYKSARSDRGTEESLDRLLNEWAQQGWELFTYLPNHNMQGIVVDFTATFRSERAETNAPATSMVEASGYPAEWYGVLSPAEPVYVPQTRLTDMFPPAEYDYHETMWRRIARRWQR